MASKPKSPKAKSSKRKIIDAAKTSKAKGDLPRTKKPSVSPAVKAIADRAEARSKGKPLPEPEAPHKIPMSDKSKALLHPAIVAAPSLGSVGEKPTETDTETERSGAGRKTLYKPEYAVTAAELCQNGATDQDLADEFDVSYRTIMRWQAKYPEFCQALTENKLNWDARIKRSLAQRAMGYDIEVEKVFNFQGSIVRAKTMEHVAADVGAANLWLTNRDKSWRSGSSRHEHTGAGGGPIEIENNGDLTQARRVAFAMGRALERERMKVIEG